MKPEISIIVPVYNVEDYIAQCIESILNQTFNEIELILVNDGSTDKSGDICDKYASKDSRIKVIHKVSEGVSIARNVGVEVSTGSYIGFVDSYDYLEKDMYAILYNLCIKNNADVSICKLGREVDGDVVNKGEDEFIKLMSNEEAMKELFKGVLYRFSLCNKLFKKSCFKNIKFPEGRIHEDLSTTYRLIANANRAVYINYIGYIYVKRSNSILTKKFYEKRLDAFIGWDEILNFMSREYKSLSNEVNTCFAYGCIDNIFYILNQVEDKIDKNKYLSNIRKYTKKYSSEVIKNSSITVNQKMIISILNINPKILSSIKR